MTILPAPIALQRLERLYQAGYSNPLVENTLNKVVAQQLAQAEAEVARLEVELAAYEQRYQLATNEFVRRWHAGQMADTADFMEWQVLADMHQELLKHIAILRDE